MGLDVSTVSGLDDGRSSVATVGMTTTQPASASPTATVAAAPNAEQKAALAVPQVVINLPEPAVDMNDGIPDILNGAAAVLWPLVLALALVLFRNEIVSLARRMKKGSAFGAEAEFERDELQTLNIEAVRATNEAAPIATPVDPTPSDAPANVKLTSSVSDRVFSEASRSPQIGLMVLSAEMDKLARRLAAATGHNKNQSVRAQIGIWDSALPPHVKRAYQLFSEARNRIIHGGAATDQEIWSAIDSGLLIYSALDSIPIEKNVVLHPNVDVYSDPEASVLMGVKALIMETTHDGKTSARIFPTTLNHYRPGMRLTWEWNMDRSWGDAWYRDPTDGEIKLAWNSSAEFVGRDLEQV